MTDTTPVVSFAEQSFHSFVSKLHEKTSKGFESLGKKMVEETMQAMEKRAEQGFDQLTANFESERVAKFVADSLLAFTGLSVSWKKKSVTISWESSQ